jgi:hypothetical protein
MPTTFGCHGKSIIGNENFSLTCSGYKFTGKLSMGHGQACRIITCQPQTESPLPLYPTRFVNGL